MGERLTSELGEISGCWTVSFRRRSKHPAERLWRALTDPEQVAAWWGSPARVDLRVGGDWYVDFGEGKGQLDGVIVRLEAERRLAFVWGRSVVEWEIEPGEQGCRYTFVHHGQAPGLSPTEEGLAAGWHGFLESIDRLLDGIPFDASRDHEEVDRLMPAYREKIQAVLSGGSAVA